MMRNLKKHFLQYFIAALCLAAAFIWYAVFIEGSQNLTVAFLDVGQGDAILINTPWNQQVLIDGGPGRQVLAEISKIMPFYDRSIDAVIATHPDSDHIGGLPDVLNRYSVDLFVESGAKGENTVSKELEKIVENKNIKKVLARRGTKLVFGKNAYMLILFPDRDVTGMNTNDSSIIAKLVYGNTSFIFTGDSTEKIEKYLISEDSEIMDADVLKIGHHGSKTSTSEEFLKAVMPELAVISAGRKNRYGHPHPEITSRLDKYGIKVLRTDQDGDIKLISDGNSFVAK